MKIDRKGDLFTEGKDTNKRARRKSRINLTFRVCGEAVDSLVGALS